MNFDSVAGAPPQRDTALANDQSCKNNKSPKLVKDSFVSESTDLTAGKFTAGDGQEPKLRKTSSNTSCDINFT